MNNIVKVIATQHQHVYTLFNRIKDLEKQMSESLLEKENWWKFVKKYVDDNRLNYIVGNLRNDWYDKTSYDYVISYNFYRGNQMFEQSNEIKYLDMTIGICKKGNGNIQNKNGIPVILNIVTEPISIEEFNKFLNEE